MIALRAALRSLARSYGFTTVAVVTLGLGLGLTASTFSFANAFLLRELPYPDADRLARVFRTSRQSSSRPHAPANLLDIRDSATSFSHVAFFGDTTFALGEPGKAAESVAGMRVTAEFFDVLGVGPELGRGFVPGEDAPGHPDVVVVSHRAWRQRHGGDPGVINRTIRLNGSGHTIIGVLPESFDAPLLWGQIDYIVPLTLEPGWRAARSRAWLSGVARLRPDVAWHQAQSELDAIAARLAQLYPRENADDGLRLAALHDSGIGEVPRRLMWLMTGVAVAMLLIACANLASLQFARALTRAHEYAVRTALGGSRRQLMEPLLLESLVLALAGGLLGLIVASWTNDLFSRLLPTSDISAVAVTIDTRVVLFAGLATFGSALAFGLAPAWLASRCSAAEALKAGVRSSTPSRSHQRLKHALLVGQLALALVLVGTSAALGLGARTFLQRDLGWEPDGLFVAYLTLAGDRYTTSEAKRAIHAQLLERLTALPGVERATLARKLPINALDSGLRTTRFVVERQEPYEDGREPAAEVDAVSPEFFATLQIPLVQGSLFSTAVRADDPPVAIVNRSFAERFWPGESPVGRRVRLVPGDTWIEVVGVVGDVRMALRLDRPETRLQLYRPLAQAPAESTTLAVRSRLGAESLATDIRQVLAGLDADLSLANPGPLRLGIERSFSRINLVVINLAISAGLSLLLAALGLFGVMSQLAVQRTRDIGVRLALGATTRSILRLVFRDAAKVFAGSAVLGVPLHLALSAVIRHVMPEMPIPGTWLIVANVAFLGATVLVASWMPARRAARTDPLTALRCE